MRLAALLAALLVTATIAQAEPVDLRGVAKRRFDDGTRAYESRRYAEALAAFREAYALAPYPQLLFNIARCQEQLGQLAEAIDSYDRYLAVNPERELRAKVEALRQKLATAPPPLRPLPPVSDPTPKPPVPDPVPPPVTHPPPPVTHPAPALVVVSAPPPRTPAYKRWWVWTVVGVAVVGVGLGVGLGLGLRADATTFPPITGRAP